MRVVTNLPKIEPPKTYDIRDMPEEIALGLLRLLGDTRGSTSYDLYRNLRDALGEGCVDKAREMYPTLNAEGNF